MDTLGLAIQELSISKAGFEMAKPSLSMSQGARHERLSSQQEWVLFHVQFWGDTLPGHAQAEYRLNVAP
jgi:hypothetical protein